jgi:hypothetical protein
MVSFRNLWRASVLFMADTYDTVSGIGCQIAWFDKTFSEGKISPSAARKIKGR